MNMAVWAACQKLESTGWKVFGVRAGFAGLLKGDLFELEASQVLRYSRLGGTFLGTSRDPDFAQKIPQAIEQLEAHSISHLMVLGGNGSLRGAAALARAAGIGVVGLPGTIDNDVAGSEDSIGFDTATNSGLILLDQFRDTAEALPRLCVLETLGGNTGFLAERIGQVGGADMILVAEVPLSLEKLEAGVNFAIQKQGFALLVASEGYPELEKTMLELERRIGLRLRFARPSHTMRGGRPSAHDRFLAKSLAEFGVDKLAQGQSGMIAWKSGQPVLVNFDQMPTHKVFTR
jgi:6-phosphofructokinase 1